MGNAIKTRIFKRPAVAALAALLSFETIAIPALDFDQGAHPSGSSQNTQTLAWEFTVNTPLRVTHLGIFDEGQNGLAEIHEIGLWSIAGTLLGQAQNQIGQGSALLGKFRYETVTPFQLAPGTYYIGASYRAGTADFLPTQSDSISTAAEITYHRGRFGLGSGLTFPNTASGPGVFFGPNFQFTSGSAPVPDAGATAGLLGLGLIGIVATRRKLRK